VDILYDNAREGIKIKESFQPLFNKECYLNMWEEFACEK
jgi:hypothetical protein